MGRERCLRHASKSITRLVWPPDLQSRSFMPLPRRPLMPVGIKVGPFVFKISNQSIKLYIYTAPIKVRLLTGASYKYARSNKTVFNNRLSCSREVSSLFRLSGRLFHTVGAETRKLLGPKRTVRVREMISSPWSADRSRTYRVPKLRNRRTNGHAENTKFPPASHTFGKHKNNCRRNITFINCCPCGK